MYMFILQTGPTRPFWENNLMTTPMLLENYKMIGT